jgi:ABC-type sugar transport system ATPase subunit
MPTIRLQQLRKQFGDFLAVNDLTIEFASDTLTCLLGPSGCGKTTLLRMIVGLETPTRGRILFGERDVTNLTPRRRNIAMVFQYPVMYQTLTVAENIRLPLENDRRMSESERARRVDEVLEVLGLSREANLRIGDLDSGRRQKVAVGRAAARGCEIILLDEPTTNVDPNAKLQLIRAFKEFTRRLQRTIIYVTHDQTEAMTLADHIALMKDGSILQCAPPRQLYNAPKDEFGGWFLGNPGMNFIRYRSASRATRIRVDLFAKPIAAPPVCAGELVLGIRPEHIRLHLENTPNAVPATALAKAIGIGGQYLFTFRVGNERIKVKADPVTAAQVRQHAFLEFPLDRVVFFANGERIDFGARYAE